MLIKLKNISKTYKRGFFSNPVQVINNVSLGLRSGKSLALVGESGAGKTTIAKIIAGLIKNNGGQVLIDGEHCKESKLSVQMVFQNPKASLDPKLNIEQILSEPLLLSSQKTLDLERSIKDLLQKVGLDEEVTFQMYPHQLSGGQQQRVSIARAIAAKPELLILDEPLSSLDVLTQKLITELLLELRDELGLTFLLITHDLNLARILCEDVAVLYTGSIVEQGNSRDVFENPMHPFTRALVSAIPEFEPKKVKVKKIILEGESKYFAKGCTFQNRCWLRNKDCALNEPVLRKVRVDHEVACLLVKK